MSTKQKRFIPADGLAGLKQNFTKDALSGFLVFLLAMPLSLGIAKASGFPMIFGLVTAIVGGVVVSFIMGSRLSIKGPAAGLIVIASGSVIAMGDGEIGWHLALGVVVVASLLQILFGVFKLGKLADFFPSAAIHGMLAAIGIIIMTKQLHLVLGINPSELKGKEPLELLGMLPSSIMHENAHLAEIGLACLLIMILMSFVKHEKIKKIPAPLIVLAVAIPLGFALHIKTDGEIAGFALVKIGSISEAFKNGLINVDFSGITTHTGIFIQYVILYSLIGSLESLLTAKAVDGMDPFKRKTDYDKDLIGVGIGNTICGILGGLPMISEVARSSANIGYGARTRWANFFHGLFLLIAVLVGVQFIEMIPNVALAAMLIFVGFRLAHPKQILHTLYIGREQLIVFLVTILITISTDLLMGVGSGILLELIINLVNGASLKNTFKTNITLVEEGENYTLNVKDDLVFSNLLGFKKKFQAIPQGKYITINVSEANIVDHSSIVTMNGLVEEYKDGGGKVLVLGFENHRQLSKDPTSTRILKLS
ncbi:SulP family inorganic anion transporter [Aurantibacillus circumpalustris]|uniref:SulP family inorganic anion transporter n=1 Tax=Aurantibacillus circumpalustris TaxID=3036359 RepID=UPI00295B21FC|nr:SulP family inorganic anion transporter [Aurantibacillus circumpalustris]